MISREELLFAEKFIAAMSCLSVKSFPFGDERFQKGMNELAKVFDAQSSRVPHRDKISLLFIRKPVTGTYDRMLEALQHLNGYAISFSIRNPRLETTEITVPYGQAEDLLEKSETEYPKTLILEAARAFCDAAEVAH